MLKDNLRSLIDKHNISVHALEKKAKLKIHSIQNILTGRSKKPSAETLQAIASVLGTTVEKLLSEK